MKLNHKIQIGLKDFILEGKFDFLKIGQTKKWVVDNFADPDGTYVDNEIEAFIYGKVQLFFHKGILYNIQVGSMCDFFSGEYIELDKWIFEKKEDLYLERVINCLNSHKCSYKLVNEADKYKHVKIFLDTSGVELVFCLEDSKNINQYELYAISISDLSTFK